MSKNWNEKQSGALLGKWFSLKSMDYRLLLINAAESEKQVIMEYILEREGRFETVKATVPNGSTIPSITEVFPEGAQMEQEAADRFPVTIRMKEPEVNISGCSMTEWGPFHPLLPEPVKFRVLTKDEVIRNTWIETGYNYRGLEDLCAGRRAEDALEILERTSALNGYLFGLAFVLALEQINETDVPEKAQWLRMILSEMSFLAACLQSLIHTAQNLGLAACGARIFKLAGLYHEAAALISVHPQFSGLLEIGGLSFEPSRETLYGVNAILQEMRKELESIRTQWENTSSISKRLRAAGRITEGSARLMTGRPARAAGFEEDIRKRSKLPWSKFEYRIPQTTESSCFARVMLTFDDALLSLDLIDQMIESVPKGAVKAPCRTDGSGEALVREPDAYGGMAFLVRQQQGRLQSMKIRSASTLNIPFLPDCLRGMEINDLPLVLSSWDLDFSSMEK